MTARALPMWFGPVDRPLWAWLHVPEAGCSHAVILCPPLGYEAWCSYRTYRTLAEQLVAVGIGALRLDYDGTGSSAGDYTDPDRVGAWLASVKLAIGELRRRGVQRVSLFGLRFGATLAALAATDTVDTVVLWDPVMAGKRYARELKAFAHAGKAADPDAPDDGLVGVHGTIYTKDTLAAISTLALTIAPVPQARRVVVLERDDRALLPAYAERVSAAGVAVASHVVAGTAALLETDNEAAQVPTAVLELIVRELGASESAALDLGVRTEIALPGGIVESVATVGPCGLFGIYGRPAVDARAHFVVMLGGGTEHQVGPGRVWIEFSRALNAQGIATLRADVNGIGDSPVRGPRSVVRSYDPEHVLDVEDLVAFGRDRGYAKVIVLGLCSGAWLAIQGGLVYPIDAIFALNPQLHWIQGVTVYPTLAETRVRELPDREREVEGERDGRWAYLDSLGIRTPAIEWLEKLVARGTRTHLAYAENDEGLQSLRVRNRIPLARLLGEVLTLEELMAIDHGMHKFRGRADVLARIVAFVKSV